jgi:hypothetical protein
VIFRLAITKSVRQPKTDGSVGFAVTPLLAVFKISAGF